MDEVKKRKSKEEVKALRAEAFKKYWEMGEERTLAKLAEELDVNVNTIYQYSAQDNWKDKIKELEDKQLEENIKNMKRHIKVKNLKFMDKLEKVLDTYLNKLLYDEEVKARDFKELYNIFMAFEEKTNQAGISIHNNIVLDDKDKKLINQITANTISEFEDLILIQDNEEDDE